MIILPFIVFILMLTLIVLIHELGHFYTSKKFGVDVEEFGIGLPPRAWGKKIKDTFYSINYLPIGGFVKLKGDDFENYDPKDKKNFINKKPWQKSIILVAGITMNIVLAVSIFYFTLGINFWQSNAILLLSDYKFGFGETINIPNVITYIEKDGVADMAKIKFGDQITEIKHENETIRPNNVMDFRDFIKNKADKEIEISTTNINTNETNVYKIKPIYNKSINQPAIGVGLNNAVKISYQKPVDKLFSGFLHSYNLSAYSFNILGSMIKTAIKTRDVSGVSEGMSGPVGVFSVVQGVMESGDGLFNVALLELAALLSLSIAIMNLLPIPALDGGRLTFVLYEWISGKKPSQKLEAGAVKYGFLFLMGLLVLITIKDVWQLFK